MAEWSIAAVLKTVVLNRTVGSNPTLSSNRRGALRYVKEITMIKNKLVLVSILIACTTVSVHAMHQEQPQTLEEKYQETKKRDLELEKYNLEVLKQHGIKTLQKLQQDTITEEEARKAAACYLFFQNASRHTNNVICALGSEPIERNGYDQQTQQLVLEGLSTLQEIDALMGQVQKHNKHNVDKMKRYLPIIANKAV